MSNVSDFYEVVLASEMETESLAAALARALTKHAASVSEFGFNLRLTGDLGAGKTSFTRALLRARGVTGRVRRPTFELVEEYDVLHDITFHHFDFYRFESPIEFEEAGFRDLFGPAHITCCEWSEKAAPYLPAADIEMTLTVEGESRRAKIRSASAFGTQLLQEIGTWTTSAVI